MSDLIEREDAINEMAEYIGCDFPRHEDAVECARSVMEQIPSARPKGEWIYVVQGWHTLRRCSVCKWAQTNSDSKYMGYKYNFCPSCGADMGGE